MNMKSHKLEEFLKLSDDEIDKERLEALALELGTTTEAVEHELAALGYKRNIMFGLWVRRSKRSGIREFLGSIWR